MKYLLNEAIIAEIEYLSEFFQVDSNILYHIVYYALACQKSPKTHQPISLQSLKETVFLFFNVNSTRQLKRSKNFQKLTKGLAPLNLKLRQDWERLYQALGDGFSQINKNACSSQTNSINIRETLELRGQITYLEDPELEENGSIEEIERAFQRCRYAELN